MVMYSPAVTRSDNRSSTARASNAFDFE